MRYTAILCLVSILAFSAALGQTSEDEDLQQTFVLGSGSNSCGDYLAAVSGKPPGTSGHVKMGGKQYSEPARVHHEWLYGYLSAYNQILGEDKQIETSNAAFDAWVRKWCEANATKPLVEAANHFVRAHLRPPNRPVKSKRQ